MILNSCIYCGNKIFVGKHCYDWEKPNFETLVPYTLSYMYIWFGLLQISCLQLWYKYKNICSIYSVTTIFVYYLSWRLSSYMFQLTYRRLFSSWAEIWCFVWFEVSVAICIQVFLVVTRGLTRVYQKWKT
jgi:hypothetical protein